MPLIFVGASASSRNSYVNCDSHVTAPVNTYQASYASVFSEGVS